MEEENKKLKEMCDLYVPRVLRLEDENKKLKEVYNACNIDSINKAFKIGNLEMENEKLKKENEKLKEENDKLKLHIEAKDKAYLALSKAYEWLQKDRDEIKMKISELEYVIQAWKKWKDEHFIS